MALRLGITREFLIDEQISNILPPLAEDERETLAYQIEQYKHVDDLIVGVTPEGKFLLDGHHRLEICEAKHIPYKTHPIVFGSKAHAALWAIRNQLGRRNLTPQWRTYLLGKKYENALEARQFSDAEEDAPGRTAKAIAEEDGVTERTVYRAAEYSAAVDQTAATENTTAPEILNRNGSMGDTKAKAPKLCDRCRRVGPVQDCPQCKALRSPPKTPFASPDQSQSQEQASQERAERNGQSALQEANHVLEVFARRITALIDDIPEDPWLIYQNRTGSVREKLLYAAGVVRTAKCSHECPMCHAEGCQHCLSTGRVTQQRYDQLVTV
jgi:hypothetical protein